MKKYLAIATQTLSAITMFRFNFLFSIVSNVLYIVVIYFLWGSIYGSGAKSLNGMTFDEVFIYLSVASTIFVLFTTFVVWQMSREVLEGSIVMKLLQPVDYMFYKFSTSIGSLLSKLITTTVPAILVIFFVFRPGIRIGANIPFFILAVVLSYLIQFNIDFLVGLLCFYNESSWGMNAAKEAIVMLLSGGVIPIAFFPEPLKSIVLLLPFQAIYNIPLQFLVSKSMTWNGYLMGILVQLFWIVVLYLFNRIFYRKAIKVVTVNGG